MFNYFRYLRNKNKPLKKDTVWKSKKGDYFVITNELNNGWVSYKVNDVLGSNSPAEELRQRNLLYFYRSKNLM